MTPRQSSGGRGTDEPTSLTCDECGTRYVPGQSFCDGCNAVLPDRAPAPRAAAPATDPRQDRPAQEPWSHGAQSGGAPSGGAPSGGAPSGGASGGGAPAGGAAGGGAAGGGAPTGGAPSGGAPAGGAPGPHHPATVAPGTPGRTAADAAASHGTASQGPAPHGPAPHGPAPQGSAPQGSAPYGNASPGFGPPGSTAPTTPAGDADPTRPVPRATTPAPAGGTGTPDPESTTDRARALLVPVADPQGEPERPPSVAPVLPGRPAPARPEVRAPVAPENHGGVACPWCHTANRPDRHFCARCAMPMAEGPENPARLPWWRRLFDYRNREQPWAGDRPRLRYQIGRILRWVVLAAVLALVGWALFQTPQAVSAVRDHFAKRAPLNPDSFKASRSYPQHGPDKAFDVVSNSWWGPGVTQSAKGEWLEARFRDPVRLLDIGITPGMSGRGQTLTKSALPHRIEARITTDDGKTTVRELNLDQGAGFQRRPFRVQNVTAVRFTIQSAYGADNKKQVAIAEIEFFGPSKASRS
ncbi:NADase-type glycan-binding domain-containing protein [Streptomyces sp. NEAU-S77]|uniref:NADase-type glycan-binding domain-containing protein n=1 Tax=Streptomyces sp. NEAU-S77 TaxID=3411033 RepID=UPI003BA31866